VRRFAAALLLACGVTAVAASPCHAQPADAAVPGRIEISIGALWIGRASFGAIDATETTGTGGTFRLVTLSRELAAAAGAEGRVALRVLRRFEVEARGSYSTPQLRSHVDVDAEASNAPILATGAIRQFTLVGAAVWYPWAPARRARLFLTGGAGYLRQLENAGTVIATGTTYEAGGGLKYALWSRDSGRVRGLGARLDVRGIVRARAVALDTRAHTSPSVGASIYVRF
jgi:hypothetical protein